MDQRERQRTQLECLYDMFRDKVEEDVIYMVYTENEGRIEPTIDQLISISACSLTGYYFDPTNPSPNHSPVPSGQSKKSPSSIEDAPPTTETAKTSLHRDEDEFKLVRRGKRSTCKHKKKCKAVANVSPIGRSESVKKPQQAANVFDASSSVGTSDNNELESIDDDEILMEDEEGEDEGDGSSLTEKIQNIQTSIENLLIEKGTCHEKASHYLSKKMFAVTSYYSELASQYGRSVEAKTGKLVDLLLMKSDNATEIDLHGLNPIQAKLVVSKLLGDRLDKLCIDKDGKVSVDIITGWGKHTVSEGNHRIRPTIVALLREKGYEYYHLNKGALRVTLRR